MPRICLGRGTQFGAVTGLHELHLISELQRRRLLLFSYKAKCKRPVNPILNLGGRSPEIGAWKMSQSEECGYDVVGKR
jgi:hypothetical protein